MTTPQLQKNYYDILGVSQKAEDQDLQKAYRRLVYYWHPDTGNHQRPIAEEQLKLVNEAYSHLKNKQFRHNYDKVLELQKKAALKTKKKSGWKEFVHWLITNESNRK